MKPLVNYGYANICFAHFLFSGMCSLEGENKGGGEQEGVKRDTLDSYLTLKGLSAVQVDATHCFGLSGTI